MNKILVINTGGTIAMTEDPETLAVAPKDEAPLNRLIPHLSSYAQVEMLDLFNLPSPHLTLEHLLKLYQTLKKAKDTGNYHGFVITHGTDTLEETAFFLDLVWPYDEPVVITGAMRSSNELGADGPVNLVHSVRVAADPRSYGKGALVVFNDEIHAARYVTKTHTSNVSTFQSPGLGPIGMITKKEIVYLYGLPQRKPVAVESLNGHVPLVKCVIGMDAGILTGLRQRGIDGLVIEAFGAGNVPPSLVPEIEGFLRDGIPIVIVSRCFQGIVQDIYGYEGGGKQLREMGAIFCNGLNGQKARIKLLVALEQKFDAEQLRSFFES